MLLKIVPVVLFLSQALYSIFKTESELVEDLRMIINVCYLFTCLGTYMYMYILYKCIYTCIYMYIHACVCMHVHVRVFTELFLALDLLPSSVAIEPDIGGRSLQAVWEYPDHTGAA